MEFLSVMGLYNFDNTILNSMVYPEGVDGDLLKNNIILEAAELEVIYPDPTFFKTAVNLWSRARLTTWERIYTASVAEYNPIENYDRYEEEETGGRRVHSGADTTSETEQHSGTDSTATTETNTNETDGSISRSVSGTESGTNNQNHNTTNQITAFDSNALQTHDKTTATAEDTNSATRSGTETETNDTTITDSKTGSNTITHGEQITTSGTMQHGEQIADTGTRESHIHGNIGVTTSQQMLESELEVAPKLNIYDYIVRDFKQRFCLLVY